MQIAALSRSWGFPFYAWLHSDGVVMKKTANEDVSTLLADQLGRRKPGSWAVYFTNYDILAFFSTQVRHLSPRQGKSMPDMLHASRGVALFVLKSRRLTTQTRAKESRASSDTE